MRPWQETLQLACYQLIPISRIKFLTQYQTWSAKSSASHLMTGKKDKLWLSPQQELMNQAAALPCCFKNSSKIRNRFMSLASSKMTIIQVLPSLEFGGVEKGVVEIAKCLVNSGHRSIVISAGGSMLPQLLETGSEHILLPVGNKSLTSLCLIH